jgi:peptidoglycan/xylan/chitin deacetylase (PgdA/CDA1 family)
MEQPAAVSVVFESLTAGTDLEAGRTGASSVSPALPTILRALGDRDMRATFFVGPETAEREPLAVTMVQNGGHELVLGAYDGAPAVRDAAFLVPALTGRHDAEPRGVNALHEALQLAVADALRSREHTILAFAPGLLERRDALAVFVETLELVEGLRAAGRMAIPTLAGA